MDAEGGPIVRRSHRIEQQLGSILLRVRGIIAKPGVSIEEKEHSIGVALEAVRRINPAIAEQARLATAPLVEILKQRKQNAPARKSKKPKERNKVSQKKGATGAMARYKEGLGRTPPGSAPRSAFLSAPIFSPGSASAAAAPAPGFAAASPGFAFPPPGSASAAAAPAFSPPPGFAFPPPPSHTRQSNILSSELDDLTLLLQGASLGPSESVMAGAPPAPPPAAALEPRTPPYSLSPSSDPVLAQLDGLMRQLADIHVTERPNYAPRSPKGGKRKTRRRRGIHRKYRTRKN
jgi:hypothetical protein